MANIATAKQSGIAPATKQQTRFSDYMARVDVKRLISEAVGKDAQRFITAISSAVSTTPDLQRCTPITVISGALLGESLRLSPSPQLGQYYLVPFDKKDKDGNVLYTNAVFILGAKGYKQLAMRSGQYLDIDVMAIKEGEYKGRDKFTGKQKFEFVEDDDERDRLETIGYMAYFELVNGFRKTVYWSKAKMLKHADTYSKAFSAKSYELILAGKIPEKEMWRYSSFWYKNFDEMAYKTIIKYLLSQWGILSIEMERALTNDNAVINEDGTATYIEDAPDAVDIPADAVEKTSEPEQLPPAPQNSAQGRKKATASKNASEPVPPPAGGNSGLYDDETLPFDDEFWGNN